MCLNDWKRHGDSYYDCTRYKENQGSPGNECTKARDALKKYLFYFHRVSRSLANPIHDRLLYLVCSGKYTVRVCVLNPKQDRKYRSKSKRKWTRMKGLGLIGNIYFVLANYLLRFSFFTFFFYRKRFQLLSIRSLD